MWSVHRQLNCTQAVSRDIAVVPVLKMGPNNRSRDIRTVAIEIIFLLIVPTLIFTFGALPPFWRYSVMEVAFGVLLFFTIKRRTPLARLGIRTDTLGESARHVLPGTLLICAAAVVAYLLGWGTGITPPHIWWNTMFFVYYWLIAIISQQFAFVGYGVDRFRMLGVKPWLVSVIIGILFSFLHSHHLSPELWVGTFALGFFWSWQYQKTPNLYIIMLSHFLIGTLTIMLGFV